MLINLSIVSLHLWKFHNSFLSRISRCRPGIWTASMFPGSEFMFISILASRILSSSYLTSLRYEWGFHHKKPVSMSFETAAAAATPSWRAFNRVWKERYGNQWKACFRHFEVRNSKCQAAWNIMLRGAISGILLAFVPLIKSIFPLRFPLSLNKREGFHELKSKLRCMCNRKRCRRWRTNHWDLQPLHCKKQKRYYETCQNSRNRDAALLWEAAIATNFSKINK